MQKKLIVLALAGLASSSAFAQTNVTIYGVIDQFLGYAKSSNNCTRLANGACDGISGGDQKFYGLQAGGLSGSRIGFKGEEALGNGLKALFVYELGNLDSTSQNNNIGQSRNAYLGLSSTWGTVVAGRINSPGYSFVESYNPMAGSVWSSQGNISSPAGMTIVAGNPGRLNNAVAYVSPNFSGFSGKIGYAFGEQTTGSNVPFAASANPPVLNGNPINASYDSAQGILGIGLDYANGPLGVGLAYHNISNFNGTPNTLGARDLDQWELGIGASYDFKIVKLFASWQNINRDNATAVTNPLINTASGFGSVDGNLWNIGGKIPVGANGAVNLSYGYYSNSISGRNANGGSNDQKVSNWGIDYEYSFSKRTTAYVGFNYMDNGNNTAFGYGATSGSVTPTADESAYLLGAGLRHTF